MTKMQSVVIFGGTGFIGSFFARHLLDAGETNRVYLFDIEPLSTKRSTFRRTYLGQDSRIEFVHGDVRESLRWFEPDEPIGLIANFAAVHREPGHQRFEYFETNLLGSENVCAWAEQIGCNNIVFSSSISPYGPGQNLKNEDSIPAPDTAYGCSKLVAEKIHRTWQARDYENRRLVIVRPGVVFGPGEGGNVSRLIKAVLHRYFFYMGNQKTQKAGTYVKELCYAVMWVLRRQSRSQEKVCLFNMSMNPSPSVKDYVTAICRVAEVRRAIPSVPYRVILAAAYMIEFFARPLRINHPFNPLRIRKLLASNHVVPNYLMGNGYAFRYTLECALTDWKTACPEDWE